MSKPWYACCAVSLVLSFIGLLNAVLSVNPYLAANLVAVIVMAWMLGRDK